ncbi:hypothetical protein GGR26_002414 [Lewinella marina]|uniref:Uncharacterized protein n=1 Tax=Neolewinella marina TaxID=438751 RepID=A0A2G0CBV7_9BACT|nr:hypothetical protein [Neolewinella marina]NJB86637.1 hypothetical protein [Neolewinella marina]PHK97446.1 hypothetical protein CGL56_15210 [Neolewinella marina]
MQSKERILRHPGLEPLWRSVEREHRTKQLTALGVITVGLLLCLLSIPYSVGLPFVGALAASLGLYWLYRLLSEQPLEALRRDLREHPRRIVWVYGMVTQRMPFGLNLMRSGTLYFYTRDGDVYDFSLRADRLLLVTKTLNRLLPHAEFGYTEERELKYRGELTPKNRNRWPTSGNE